jgi:hypothetical protein
MSSMHRLRLTSSQQRRTRENKTTTKTITMIIMIVMGFAAYERLPFEAISEVNGDVYGRGRA